LTKIKLNIVILGAGNLAWHLSQELKKRGQNIIQVYNRTVNKAEELSKLIQCEFTSKIEKINNNADLYILCINDKALIELSNSLPIKNKLVVHTSGAASIDFISQPQRGVFYPLQTFSKEKEINFKEIPICIEAKDDNNKRTLIKLGNLLSDCVYEIDSDQRKTLHLAAVFANNFSNYMYSISEKILSNKNIPFDILKPLIMETASKVLMHSPKESQTGPAIRNDQTSIKTHLDDLKHGNYYDIYKLLTEKLRAENN
tara:strand:+ start:1322 stop:2092 length:771 start_codon:yes stop_codon:yes gene_type:complete